MALLSEIPLRILFLWFSGLTWLGKLESLLGGISRGRWGRCGCHHLVLTSVDHFDRRVMQETAEGTSAQLQHEMPAPESCEASEIEVTPALKGRMENGIWQGSGLVAASRASPSSAAPVDRQL